MSLNFKKLRSLLALTLSAAMILTAVPQTAVVSSAAEIEEYQTSKLKVSVNKKNTTVYNGQEDVEVATVTYADATRKEGKYFWGEAYYEKEKYTTGDIYVYCPEVDPDYDYDGTGDGTLDGPNNGKTVLIAVSPYASAGKYTIKLYPVTPDYNSVYSEPVSFTITVKTAVKSVSVNVASKIYKPANKAATLQAKATVSGNGTPANKNVNWSVSWSANGAGDCGKDVTVSKSGKITIAKTFVPSEEKSGFYVQATAADGQGAKSKPVYVAISSNTVAPKKVLVAPYEGEDYTDKTTFTIDEIGYEFYVDAFDADGKRLDCDEFIFVSNNPKVISVTEEGCAYVEQVTGKPVTITATAKDGSKQKVSTKITVKKNTVSVNDIVLDGYVSDDDSYRNFYLSGESDTFKYSLSANAVMMSVYVSMDGYGVPDAKIVKVQGGKDVTSKIKKLQSGSMDGYCEIIPTSATVVVTVKAGKETKDFTFVNETYVSAKNPAKVGTTLTLKKQNESQSVSLYVGAKEGSVVKMRVDQASAIANKNTFATAEFLYRYSGLKGSYTVDEKGCITVSANGIAAMLDAVPYVAEDMMGMKGAKAASSFKMQVMIFDAETKEMLYAPSLVTVKFANVKAAKRSNKLDFKMKADYKLSATEAKVLGGYETTNYAQLTYTGKQPTANYGFYNVLGSDLSKDLKSVGPWTQAIQMGHDEEGNAYLYVTSYGLEVLREANDGKGGEVTGYVYVACWQETEDYSNYEESVQKVKVTVVIPEESTIK